MEIIASTNGSSNYEPVPAGNYVARCISMVHIGTITEEYLGEKKTANKIRVTWELPTETKVFNPEKGEQPFVLSKEFTLSLHEKSTLRKWLESWRGRGFTQEETARFDVSKLVGAACMLNVIHTQKNGNTYANISSISAMPKGLQCPAQINQPVVFSVLQFDEEKFNSFPEFIKDKIKASKEYRDRINYPNQVEMQPEHEENVNGDLPF